MKHHRPLIWISAAALVLCLAFNASALDWHVSRSMKIDGTPIDMAASENGRYIYVLTDAGKIAVFEAGGKYVDTADVGTHIQGIAQGPSEDSLFVFSQNQKSVQIISMEFIHEFDLAGSPSMGPADAPVVLVEFSEFECGFCARLSPVLKQVQRAFPDKVRLVFKNFPLNSHKHSRNAALAALAADRQGQFWAYHDRLFQNQNQLSDAFFRQTAQELGLDLDQFEADMKNPALLNQVRRDFQAGLSAGIRGVPSAYINGKRLKTREVEAIKAEVKKILAEMEEKKTD